MFVRLYRIDVRFGFRTGPDTGMMGRMRSESSDEANVALILFCEQLSQLRADAGGPTLRELSRIPGLLSTSQLSEIFAGKIKKLPDRDVIRLLVTACISHARDRTLRGPRDVGHWLARYDDLAMNGDRHRQGKTGDDETEGPFAAPIEQWNPFALGVHHAITVDGGSGSMPTLPPYVMRRHDLQLRQKLAKVERGTMAVLVGESSTGKTRAMLEAVRACLPHVPLVHPPNAEALIALTETVKTPAIVWLNETQRYLDGPHGPAAALALHRLLIRPVPVVVLGSMWLRQHWERFTARAKPDKPDLHEHARELLLDLAERIDVPPNFDDAVAQRELARSVAGDRRLAIAQAIAMSGRVIQVLAGGVELANRYDHPTDPYSHAVITAAIDARRLGFQSLLPAALLREAAPGYLDGEQRSAPAARSGQWFTDGLSDAQDPIHGIAALMPDRRRVDMGDPEGYELHDYVDQHGRTVRRPHPVPGSTWSALIEHAATEDELGLLVGQALDRGLYRYAYGFFVKSIAAGKPPAGMMRILDYLKRTGRQSEARLVDEAGEREIERFRGKSDFSWSSFFEHQRRTGTEVGFEARFLASGMRHSRPPVSEFDTLPDDLDSFIRTLRQSGESDQIERVLRLAVESNRPQAVDRLVKWLESNARHVDAERVLRDAFAANRPHACERLVTWLTKSGRSEDAEQVLWTAVAGDDHDALYRLTNLLKINARHNEIEYVLRDAVVAGHFQASGMLFNLLSESQRLVDAENALRYAILLGHQSDIVRLVMFLRRNGRDTESDQLWHFGLTPDGQTSPAWE